MFFNSQGVLDSVSEGQKKLDAACKEGESLYGCLSKPVVSNIQEQIANSKQNFQEFLNQCLNDKKALEACASHLGKWVIPVVTNRLHEMVWLPKCRAKYKIVSSFTSPVCFMLWKYLREIEVLSYNKSTGLAPRALIWLKDDSSDSSYMQEFWAAY